MYQSQTGDSMESIDSREAFIFLQRQWISIYDFGMKF